MHVVELQDFLFSCKNNMYIQVMGQMATHTEQNQSGGIEFFLHCWRTMIQAQQINIVPSLIWDARLCRNTSRMSRSRPVTSSLHGCLICTEYPLRELRRGWVRLSAFAPFIHTHTLITVAGFRVQTIHLPYVQDRGECIIHPGYFVLLHCKATVT
jgi:hypothetical protein